MSVILSTPIRRKGGDVSEVSITEAVKQAGSLRGLRLVDVLNFDFDATSTLLTRCTSPALTATEIASLETSDFVALIEELTPFLTKAAASSSGVTAAASE